jgi:hypothetical protein
MSLPTGQQRVLDRMEDALRASEPRLNSMYAMFACLSVGEPIAAERLARKRLRWLRHGSAMYAIVLIPVLFVAIVIGALLSSSARSAGACEVGYSVGGVSPLASKPSCPAPGKASVVKTAARKAVSARLTCIAQGSPARFTMLAGRSREFPAAPPTAYTAAGAPGLC